MIEFEVNRYAGLSQLVTLTHHIPADSWPRIKAACKTLGISTCDWLLASVEHSARHQMKKRAAAAAAA